MKHFASKLRARGLFASLVLTLLATATGCDAFRSLRGNGGMTAQGRPYELIIVSGHNTWNSPLGDTLRSVFTAPVAYLAADTEPLFDVLRINEQGYTGTIAQHRNILEIALSPELTQASAAVRYDVTARPQIVVTLQGPSQEALTDYLSEHRAELVQVFEQAERDRAIRFAEQYFAPEVSRVAAERFGVEMQVPRGYIVAASQPDFVWARYEYPQASQGFFLYSYPYEGPQSLTPEALVAARNKFAARIPGPSDGSYMTTSEVIPTDYRLFKLEGRTWCELRGFWDVAGDFMGGPFVSFTTVDKRTNRVFTLDGYIYSPKLHKRNFLRGVEHLLYSVKFPDEAPQDE